MRKHEPISKIMTTDVITVHVGEPVSKARHLFLDRHVHHLPVVSGESLVGIISWTDMLRVTFDNFGNQDDRSIDTLLDHTYKLETLMNSEPVTVTGNQSIRDAAELLATHDFHSLPVVQGNKLIGIATSTDLIRYLAELF